MRQSQEEVPREGTTLTQGYRGAERYVRVSVPFADLVEEMRGLQEAREELWFIDQELEILDSISLVEPWRRQWLFWPFGEGPCCVLAVDQVVRCFTSSAGAAKFSIVVMVLFVVHSKSPFVVRRARR